MPSDPACTSFRIKLRGHSNHFVPAPLLFCFSMEKKNRFAARDVWKQADLGTFAATHTFVFPAVGPHDCVMLRFDPVHRSELNSMTSIP